MNDEPAVCNRWELTPHYKVYHTFDAWCPRCNYMMHFVDEMAPHTTLICRGCQQPYTIGDYMNKELSTEPSIWTDVEQSCWRGNIEERADFVTRNLAWWKEVRSYEPQRRKPYYRRFLDLGDIYSLLRADMKLAEVGPGAFGGMIEACRLNVHRKYFIDYILRELVELQFIEWPKHGAMFIHAPAEQIPLSGNAVDLLISCNALDHGWDAYKAVAECIRVSKRCALSFDCRGDSAKQRELSRNDKDHAQLIHFGDMRTFLYDTYPDYWIRMRDAKIKDYPVAYIEIDKGIQC